MSKVCVVKALIAVLFTPIFVRGKESFVKFNNKMKLYYTVVNETCREGSSSANELRFN